MATVYSLICWGGRTGRTATISIASPAVVTMASHGGRNGMAVVFSTTGSLPTGIVAGTTYYLGNVAQNTANLYTDVGLTSIVNTSGSQSGTHTAKSATMIGLFAEYSGRWGAPGSERCYDGISSMLAVRNGAASLVDPEVIEFGEAFTEYATIGKTLRVGGCPYTLYTSTIDGFRTPAFHGGNIGQGYINLISNYGHTTGRLVDIDGITFEHLNSSGVGPLLSLSGSPKCSILNSIFIGKSTSSGSVGIIVQNGLSNIQRNLIIGFTDGLVNYDSIGSGVIAFNTVSKCANGIRSNGDSLTYRLSSWVNNISVGNATNWRVQPTTLEYASGNAGESGDPIWTTTGGSSVVMSESDFADYANNNFRPALASSPQVDSAIPVYGESVTDIADAEVPNYNNGGSEGADIGAFEYDHGYGPHPASATISLTSIVSGSRVLITKASDGTVLYNDVPGTSLSFSTTHIGDFNVVVRKATASPFYREFNASGTTVADQTTSIKCLQQLDE